MSRKVPGGTLSQLFLQEKSDKFENADPQEILAWACAKYSPRITMATGFGAEGMVLIHMLAEISPDTPVFNLETGYQFKESLVLTKAIERRYGIQVELKQPKTSVDEYEKIHGGPVYMHSPDQCCHDRKVEVLKEALTGMSAWITAVRRDQGPTRADAPIVSWDNRFGLVKVNPLVNWTRHDVWEFIEKNDIPYNALYDEAYSSIGCWPCTQKASSNDERAGRWVGLDKTECGIHLKK